MSAANGVWNGTQTAYWTNSANWSASPYPSGTSETASFTNAGNGQTTLNLNGLASIKNITFDSPLVAAYTNGTGATNSQTLVMADSGEFTLSATAGNSQTFNAGIQLGTDRSSQSYSFRNDNPSRTLTFNNVFGPASGGTAGGTKTLTVNGIGNVEILGNVRTNGATFMVLTHANSGTLTLSGSNIVTTLNMNGGTNSIVDIGSGYLFLNNFGATILSSSQGGTINGSGTIQLSTVAAPNFGDVRPAAGKTLVINPTIYSDGGFELNDLGTVVLNGTNNFLGDVYFTGNAGGTISVRSIGNKGSTTSNLGRGSKIMMNYDNSRLLYTGTGETTDRYIELQKSFILDHSGTGKLLFTAPVLALGNTKTLTLQGSSSGIGEFSGAISNGTGTTSLTKNGFGTWILSGTNLYAGATTVNGGALLVNSPGSTAPASAVTVNTGTVLGGNGIINGVVTMNAGALLVPGAANAFGTLNLSSNLTLNGCALLFDIDASNATTDSVTVARTLTLTGSNTIYPSFPNGVATIGTNTLMTFSSRTGSGTFALAPGCGSAFLITTATSVSLAVTNAGTYSLSWKGTDSDVWDSGALNWTNGESQVAFNDGDAVAFDDTASRFDVSSTGTVAPASVAFNNSLNDYTVSASIGGTSPILKLGTATATLSGTNTFSGPVSISGGTLKIGGSGKLGGGNYAGTIVNAGVLEYASSAAQTNSGVILGAGAVTASGNGTLTLSGNNTYSGQTTVSGAGTLVICGNSTCSGPTVINAGVLKALHANALGGTGTGTTVGLGGTLELAGDLTYAAEPLSLTGTLSSQTGINTYAGAATFQPGASINVGAASTLILSAATVANTYGFTKVGEGTLRLTADPAQTGPFVVTQGTLELQHGGSTDSSFSIAPGATLRVITANDIGDTYSITNNGTLDLRAVETIGALVGSGLVTVGLPVPITFGIGNDSRFGTFSGVIENGLGTLSLTKYGTGIQILTGACTYTGPTVLNANGGTLLVNSPGSLATISVTVNSGATLGGSGSISGPVTVAAGGNLAPAGAGTLGTLTLGGALTLNGGMLLCDISTSAPSSDAVAVSGALTLNGVNTVALSFPSGAAPVGDYTLMTFASKVGTGSFALLGSYPTASLELTDTSLLLHVIGGSSAGLTWNGNLSTVWDGGILNWKLGSSATNFAAGSAVTFDDSAVGPNFTVSGGTVTPSSILFNNSLNNYNVTATLAGTAPVAKFGSGTTTLSTSTTYNPTNITVNNGTLAIGGSARLNSGTYTTDIAINGGTFNPGSSSAQTLGGIIFGAGTLSKSGTGALTLTNANSFSGGTSLSAGQLNINNGGSGGTNSAIGRGTLTITGGSIDNTSGADLTLSPIIAQSWNGNFTYVGSKGLNLGTGAVTLNANRTVTVTANTLSVGGAIGQDASGRTLTKNGAGALVLSGASTYSGGTTLSAGTLYAQANAAALGTGNLTLSGASTTLELDNDIGLAFNRNTTVSASMTLKSGRLTAGPGVTHTLGTLLLNASTLSVAPGTNVTAHSPYGLTFGTTGLTAAPAIFDVSNNGTGLGMLTLGAVTNTYPLTKRGAGTLKLVGVNTFTGATTNYNGKLLVVTGGSSSNSAVVIQASGIAAAAPALSALLNVANTQWTCASLTFSAASAPATNLPALDFLFSVAPSTTVAPLRVRNNVDFGTNPVVNVYLCNFASAATNYPLMVVGGIAPTNVIPPLNMIGGYTNSALFWTNNTLTLKLVGTPLPLKWNPGVSNSGTWDVNNSANTVWTNGVAAAYYQEPLGTGSTGDSVLFDDAYLTAGSTVTLNSFASPTSMTVSNALYSYTLSGSGAIAGITGLTKQGTNALTLAIGNTYSGATTVSAGTLNIPVGGAINAGNTAGSSSLSVANLAASAVVNISGGALNAKLGDVSVGTASGSAGVINLSSGTLTASGQFYLGAGGNNVTGFGALNVSGGDATFGSYLTLGRASGSTGLNRGELLVSGGTVTVSANNLEIGSYQNAVASTCVATLTGGTTTMAVGAGDVLVGNNCNGVLNVSGSAALNILNPNKSLRFGNGAGVKGIANLNGGVVTAAAVTQNGSSLGYLHFDGGTLKASRANTSFMTGLTAARIYGGGAVIDDGGYAITISQSLLSPVTGNGVSLAGMTFSGKGFVAPPIVDIAGYGVGASAVATIDESGTLTGVSLTSPGVNYYMGTPTLTFTGGGGTVTQTGSASTAPNTSGGLTKIGAGTLTLTGTNTYSGATVVNNGRLTLVSGASCGSSAATVQSSGSGAAAILGVRYTGANAQATFAGLTTSAGVGGGSAPALEFSFAAAPSATVAPLAVTGDATFGTVPGVTVILSTLSVPTGIYPLLTVGGTAPAAVPTLTVLGGYSGSSLSWSGNTLNLNLAGSSAVITWGTGLSGDGFWDVNNSANLLWRDGASAPTYYRETAGVGDQVLFDDTFITANTLVTVNTAVTPTSVTANNTEYRYTLSGSGAIAGAARLTKTGPGLLTLSGANTYSGGTAIAADGVLEAAVAGALGTGSVTNDGTLNLTAGVVTYTGLSTGMGGAGTNNVTLGAGTAITVLSGNYSAFTGVWNIGVGAPVGSGRAQMDGLDNPAATLNVLPNATLWAGLANTRYAHAILYGGDTGENYGQFRLDNTVWAGPVTIAGPITVATDGHLGSASANATISGIIDEQGGPYEVSKLGNFTLTLTGNNTFRGPIAVKAGTLGVNSLKSVGAGPSALGAPTTPAEGVIKLGYLTTAGGLLYTGMGDTSDRLIDLAGTTAGGTLTMSGTNQLTLAGDLISSGIGIKILTLQGSTLGTGVVAGVINNTMAGNTVSLYKGGTGVWRLSNANLFTGGVNIDTGVVIIAKSDSLGVGVKTITISNGSAGNPQLHLDGTDGDIVLGTNILFQTSNTTVGPAIKSLAGNNSIAGKINLTGGGGDSAIETAADTLTLSGRITSDYTLALRNLRLRGNGNGEVTGTIDNGSTTVGLVCENGTGTWTLSASNSFTSASTVSTANLVIGGVNGFVAAPFTVYATGVLTVANSVLANSVNRLGDTASLTLSGGLFAYSHTGGEANYSERTGALIVSLGTNTVVTSLADVGQTSVLTFASLARSGGATVNFMGEGLGESDQNRLFLTAQADGPIGLWATVNGTNLAAYSSTRGVYAVGSESGSGIANLAARGPDSVITNSATTLARITLPGEDGPITLQGDWTNSVLLVQQKQAVDAVIANVIGATNKTLLTSGLTIAAGQGSLTLGENPGNGYLAALTSGANVLLENDNEASLLTVNAAVVNNTTASALDKYGAGRALLAGSNTFSGAVTINEGTLEFGGPFGQRLSNVIAGNGVLSKSGTNMLQILGANTYTGPTYINAGMVRADKDSTFGVTNGTVYIADGATLNVGCTPDVGGTRAKDGINFGTKQFVVSGVGYDGAGVINNISTASQYNAFSRISLAGPATFGAYQRWDIGVSAAPALDLNDYTLTKTGALDIALHGAIVNPGAGHIVLNQGILRFESTTRVNGTAANTNTVNSGGILELYNLSPSAPAWSLVLNGGAFFRGAGTLTTTNQNIWTGPVRLNGRAFLNANQANINWTITGDISGTGTLVRAGSSPSTLWLTSSNNTYSGGTIISNGTLFAKYAGSLPGYEAGQVTVAGGATLALASGDGENGWSADQIKSLHDTSRFTNSTAVLSIDTALADVDYQGNLTKTLALTKRGNNTLTLRGTNTFMGALTVNGGTLVLPSTSTNLTGSIFVGGGATNATLLMNGLISSGSAFTTTVASVSGDRSSATLTTNATFGRLFMGNIAGASGAFIQKSGTLAVTPATGSSDYLDVGNGGYGYYRMLSGTLSVGQLALAGTFGGSGVFDLYSGTVTVPSANGWLIFNWGNGGGAVLNMFGGSLTAPPSVNDTTLSYNGNAANFSALNMLGSSAYLDTTSNGRSINMARTAGSFLSAINLNSGTILANKIYAGVTGTPTVFGFGGGTLRANTTNGTFMQGLTAAVVYPGGAVIDSTNVNVTISQSLVAPQGYGVSYIPVLSGGTNYIGAPTVKISGGSGQGATAIASVDLEDESPTKGQVTGITVTSAGTGYQWYDTLTVALSGGGFTAPATVGPCLMTLNVASGGLTKLGSGTLMLAGTNSFGGMTTISGGTLRLGLANALPTNAPVTVAGGTYDLGGFAVTNGPLTLLSGSIINGTLNAGLTKESAATATLGSSYAATTPLVISGGTLQLTGVQPGLYEGRVPGAFELTLPNPQTATKLSATNAYLYFASNGASGGIWVDNSTYIYTGYLWNRATSNEVWTFNKYFDDSVLLKIDGNVVINNGVSNTNLITNYTMTPGPHALELRLGQGTGAVGFGGGYPGVGFDRMGRYTRNAAYFQGLADLGDGSLLTLSNASGTNLLDAASAVEVAANATLNLGGTVQTLDSLSGSGLVSNGTLAVTGTIAPGGTNVIGTLSVAASATVSGTLLVDVDASGNSDRLAVQGNLNLSGLNLEIANLEQLDTHKVYTLMTYSGTRTGTFSDHNLPSTHWHITYSNGAVKLIYFNGTLIRLR